MYVWSSIQATELKNQLHGRKYIATTDIHPYNGRERENKNMSTKTKRGKSHAINILLDRLTSVHPPKKKVDNIKGKGAQYVLNVCSGKREKDQYLLLK